MKIAFVGCGYVFDIYMRTKWAYPEIDIRGVFDIDLARSGVVGHHYGIRIYESLDDLLADPAVEVVVNLTSIHSHFDVTRRALLAGKHVYAEKPITLNLDQTRELFALAEKAGVVLAAAPCNLFSDAISTMWKAVQDGAIGRPVLVYAELDDNPAHLMALESVRSPTGAPFPYKEELQEGCTIEHIGYHLAWICAMFGPATSVSAISACLVEPKTAVALSPSDTADLSVACLTFANGVVARVTCSWVAPRNHGMRIIGDQGEISADNVFHDQTVVRLERFSRVSLSARKSYSVRNQPLLGRLFGIEGRQLPLVRRWKSHAVEAERGVGRSVKHRLISWLRRREVYAQDKLLGLAEMERALQAGQPQPMPPDFLIHLNELTLMVQNAGRSGIAVVPTTTFERIGPLLDVASAAINYRTSYSPRFSEKLLVGVIGRLHGS